MFNVVCVCDLEVRVAMDTKTAQLIGSHHGRDESVETQLITGDTELRQVATPL